MRTWNERLALAMAERGLNANKLAIAMGVKPPTVSAWVGAGSIKPAENINGENLLKVCSILNIRPEWLVFREGPMHPVESQALTPEMQKVISTLIEIDRAGGPRRNDALYFMNRLLTHESVGGQKVG